MMKWFGKHWGSRLCNETERVETPVGCACEHCSENIAATDDGFVIPHITKEGPREGNWHYECYTRCIVGSVAYQLKQCSCFILGASEIDPPGMTRRQSAKLAVEMFEGRQGGAGYVISADGASITCLTCGATSYNASDVQHRYCARCKVFRDDR